MKFVAFILSILMITGCGGSGEGNSNSPTATQNSIDLTEFKNVYTGATTDKQYNFKLLKGNDSLGRSWSGSHYIRSYGPTTFESQNTTSSNSYTTFQQDGISYPQYLYGFASYYLASNGNIYEFISSSAIFNPALQPNFPSVAKIGESGILAKYTHPVAGTINITWLLNADINGVPIFTIKYEYMFATDMTTATIICSYYLDTNGSPSKLDVSSERSGLTINLSGYRS